MKTYKIDKGIKIPAPSLRRGAARVSMTATTINMLKKTESFLVKSPIEAMKAEKAMRDFMHRERKDGGSRRFSARRTGGGVRIWRVK